MVSSSWSWSWSASKGSSSEGTLERGDPGGEPPIEEAILFGLGIVLGVERGRCRQ